VVAGEMPEQLPGLDRGNNLVYMYTTDLNARQDRRGGEKRRGGPKVTAVDSTIRLGPISHIGIAVDDCEKAAEWWERTFGLKFSTGVYVLDEASEFHYRGQPAKSRMKAAISTQRSDPSSEALDIVFVELVEVMEGESPHTEYLRAHGEGLQHVAFSVEDLDADVEKLAADGIVPILQYKFAVNLEGHEYDVKEVYLNTAEIAGSGGTTVQLIELRPRGV
jgi:methylmalonyl-CoA/ethylmalonyl-CoA epimerase